MFAAVALLVATAGAPQEIRLRPTDDVWVYSYASDPAGDTFLRAWGMGGTSVPDDPSMVDGYSFGYLRFDVSKAPAGAKLASARLDLTSTANPGYALDDAKSSPLEVRALSGMFKEGGWNYEKAGAVHPMPGLAGLFGFTHPDAMPKKDQTFVLSVDLLHGKGDFSTYLATAEAGKDKAVCLAICSALDPASQGRESIYKVYSREGPPGTEPVLRLTFASSR